METIDDLLIKASRTFALTIPLLDEPLRKAMGLAYLLMRNADTLEDAWQVPRERRIQGLMQFVDLVERRDIPGAELWVEAWEHQPGFDDPDHHHVLLQTPRLLRELRGRVVEPRRDVLQDEPWHGAHAAPGDGR